MKVGLSLGWHPYQSHQLEAVNDELAQDTADRHTTEVDQRHFTVQVQEATPKVDSLPIVHRRQRIEVALVLHQMEEPAAEKSVTTTRINRWVNLTALGVRRTPRLDRTSTSHMKL